MRVACYERVSTDEQVKHGLSIDTQKTALAEWCKQQKHTVIGHYCDEGVSGGKAIEKRPQMLRLLKDVEEDKVDLIIFTKLDRWFRSIKNYYKVQDILDSHHVAWNAIHEDYETQTASGIFKVNIMLAVAENERQRTSERIKDVFDYKKRQGQYTSGGQAVPWGYKAVDNKLVKDPDAQEVCQVFWDKVTSGMPYTAVAKYISDTYHVYKPQGSWARVFHNPIYTGLYHGKHNFCEPYVSEADFNRLHTNPAIRYRSNGRAYYFTGLIRCPICNGRMTAHHKITQAKREYVYYECSKHITNMCPYNKGINEETLEKALKSLLKPSLQIRLQSIESTDREATEANLKGLRAKLKRIGQAYADGAMEYDSYHSQVEEIKMQISQAESTLSAPETTAEEIRALIETDILSMYDTFNREEKRTFWSGLIDRILLTEQGEIKEIIYLP